MKTRSISQWSRTSSLAAYLVALPLCLALAATIHAQTLTTLHSFNGTDGAFPFTQLVKTKHRLVQHSNGNFYSTTPLGGASNAGTVFQVTPSGVVTTLYSFCSIGGSACTDGSTPQAALAIGKDGNLYGSTFVGGANNAGTVFKITTGGALTTLYSFCSKTSCADGANPLGALVQGSDGNFYGTTYTGGNSTNSGTVFQMTPGGSVTTLYSFSGPDGANPQGDLVPAPFWDNAGNFYGSTFAGGNSSNAGTLFTITRAGALTTLYSFCSKTNCTDGANPNVPLVQDVFGNLYGTTASNGANAGGTVFRVAPWGSLRTLYHFCAKTNCVDGAQPTAGPIVGSDGNIYGTTFGGGANNYGTAFQVTPWGVESTLYDFCSQANCTDGANPEGALVQVSNGSFFGTTAFGGTSNLGTAFSLATLPATGSTCNGIYSGTYFGNIRVTNGQTCEFTDGGIVIGNIYVTGGNLILTNASVLGNVEIQGGTYSLGPSLSIASRLEVENLPSGSAQNTICGVTVRGSLEFEGNGSAAQIGASTGSCPGNTIGGDLDVNNNTAAVQVFNNTVRDNLQCQNNSSITGAGNSARNKTGQCSTF